MTGQDGLLKDSSSSTQSQRESNERAFSSDVVNKATVQQETYSLPDRVNGMACHLPELFC